MEYVFDGILAALLALFIVRGLLRGLIKEIAGFIGLLLGFFVSARYYPLVAPHLSGFIDDKSMLNIVSYILVFMAVLVAVKIFSVGVEKFMSVTSIGWLNHLLGGGVGVLKGALICAIAITLVTHFVPDAPFLKTSVIAPYFDDIIAWGKKMLPPLL